MMVMMNRPDLLTDTEQKIVDAHRQALQQESQSQKTASTRSISAEIEDVISLLTQGSPYDQNERQNEAVDRLRNLLY